MALIKKVKDWLGIEGVKIALSLPETMDLKDRLVTGSYSISTQSDQYIESVTLILKEKYSRGRRKSKLIDEYILKEETIIIDAAIMTDEVITQEFELTYDPLKSAMDKMGDKNFLYRGLTSIAKIIKNTKSTYTLIAEVSVKGNKLKPYDKMELVAD